MTVFLAVITDVLNAAMQPGPIAGPTALLTALETESSPLQALMCTEEADAIGIAIEQDFGFLRFIRMRPEAIDSGAKERWAALIRWLLACLNDWSRSEDERLQVLAAILLTSKMCGGGVKLWDLFPDENVPSGEFLKAIGKLLTKLRAACSSRGVAEPPIWENDLVELFQKSDAAGNWAKLAEMWPQFACAVIPNPLVAEMVRCLAHYAFGELVRAISGLQQFPLIMEMVQALSIGQRFRLAIASDSERVRFCCVFASVTLESRGAVLSSDEEAALSDLLVKVAGSAEEWRKWMKAFNTHPLRYPSFHRPLGHALARISYEAAMSYVDSIELHPICARDIDESRSFINDCLRVFSQQASPEYRHAVWIYAYRRWCDWRFGAEKTSTNLFEINRSQLDFAVVSYAYECMSATEREKALVELQKELSEVELTWHTTETDCTTEWNRLLSSFQIFAHALSMAKTGKDVLPDSCIYYPAGLLNSPYFRIMFRVPEYPTALCPVEVIC